MPDVFPSLDGWEPTRDTLAAYARVLGAVRRAATSPHPRWWHISLRPVAEGLTTGEVPADEGAPVILTLDLAHHRLEIERGARGRRSLDLAAGMPAASFGDRTLALLRDLGFESRADRAAWSGEQPLTYDLEYAARYRRALLAVTEAFLEVRKGLSGERGPVQLWPHHFDLSFEWFGGRQVEGEGESHPTQIGFGFAPGDDSHPDPYFYANPWPLDPALPATPLPGGARWMTEAWEGSLLPYETVRGTGRELLLAYLNAVFEAASPALR